MEYTKLLGKVTLTTDGLHDSSIPYNRLCLVHDDAYRSFISIKEVPANISIDNRSYWQPLNVISADNEDLMVDENLRLKFADREYNPTSFNGMGYNILRKRKDNILTQEDFAESNTLYVIKYNFYLADNTITIPENCAFYFEGGTINAGTITGTDTIAYGTVEHKGNATFNGTWLFSGASSNQDIEALEKRIEALEKKAFPYTLLVTGGGVFKKGSLANITVSWLLTQGSTTVLPDKVTINDVEISVDQTSKVYPDVFRNAKYTVTCVKEGITFTGEVEAKFVNPSYFGVVSSNYQVAELTEQAIKGLGSGEIVKDTKSYVTPEFTQNSQLNCYAYPKQLGLLESIKDMNNHELQHSYRISEVKVNGELYYVYLLGTPASVTDYKIIFN